MHVLAIYRVNEHLGELLADAAAERRAKEAQPKAPRLAFRLLRFGGRTAVSASGPTKAFANT
jgi:hypothetical protein